MRALGIGGGLLSALGPLGVSILTPAFPQLAEMLGSGTGEIAAATTVFLAGFAVAQLVVGALSDGFGRGRVAIIFLSVFILSSIGAMVAATLEAMLFFRTCQGMGAAVGISTARALTRDWFTGAEGTRVINTMYLLLGVVPTLSPVIGSFIAASFGARWIFGALAVYGIGLVLFIVRLDPGKPGGRAAGGLSPGRLASAVMRLLRHAGYMRSSLAVAGVSGALYGQSAALPTLLMSDFGFTPKQFGLVMTAQAACHVAGSLSARFWLGRVSSARLVVFALLLVGASALWLLGSVIWGASALGLVGPVALAAFGGAHSYPVLVTAGAHDLPDIAGTGASLLGSLQMGMGALVAAMSNLPFASSAPLALSATLTLSFLAGSAWLRLQKWPDQ